MQRKIVFLCWSLLPALQCIARFQWSGSVAQDEELSKKDLPMWPDCAQDFGTLETRLNNARRGETVYVCPGTIVVREEIIVATNSISLICAGEDHTCILGRDGTEHQRRILLVTGRSFTLTGMKLRDGRTENSGGGVLFTGGGVHRIVRCLFEANYAKNGGGVFFTCDRCGGHVDIQRTTFIDNVASIEGGAASVYRLGPDSFANSLYHTVTSESGSGSVCEGIYEIETQSCHPLHYIPTLSPSPAKYPLPVWSPSPTPYSLPTLETFSPSPFQDERTCIDKYTVLNNALESSLSKQRTFSVCQDIEIFVAEEIKVVADGVTLQCSGPSGSCILDGQGTSRLLNVIGKGFTLSGMVIKNGKSAENGGGVLLNDSGNVIENCSFQTNKADNGGGLYCNGRTSIENTSFSRNSATGAGGAAYLSVSGASFISNTGFDNGAGEQCDDVYDETTGLCVPLSQSTNIRMLLSEVE